jgi:hypothetical protein
MRFFYCHGRHHVSSPLAKKREATRCKKEQHPMVFDVGIEINDCRKYRYYRWNFILVNHHASTYLT